MTMTRNRVKYWAEQKNWNKQEIYRQAVLAQQPIGKSTIDRLYDDPGYLASPRTLEALARVFGLRYTDMIEDVDVPEQSNHTG